MADAMSDIPDFNRFCRQDRKILRALIDFFFWTVKYFESAANLKMQNEKYTFIFILNIENMESALPVKRKIKKLWPYASLWTLNTGNVQFSTLFSYMLWDIELKFCMWLCFNVLQIKFKCRHSASVWLSFCSSIFCSCLLYESGWNLKFDSGLFNVFLLE